MKGFLISIVTFVLYVISSTIAAHIWRPKRHAILFILMLLAWTPGYLLLYFLTPADVYFLPAGWTCSVVWLDVVYGLIVLYLNCHSFIDMLQGTCGGFSVALLIAIWQARGQPATSDDLLARFKMPDGTDRIFGWRVPYLESRGYFRRNPRTEEYTLTPKSRVIAVITRSLKWVMNLDKGG